MKYYSPKSKSGLKPTTKQERVGTIPSPRRAVFKSEDGDEVVMKGVLVSYNKTLSVTKWVMESLHKTIGKRIGLKGADHITILKLGEKVRVGFKYVEVSGVTSSAKGAAAEYTRAVGISLATVNRAKKNGTFSPEASAKIYNHEKLIALVEQVYAGDSLKVEKWLHSKHTLLGGETPFDIAHGSPAGLDAVIDLLDRAAAGVYV